MALGAGPHSQESLLKREGDFFRKKTLRVLWGAGRGPEPL